MDQTGRSVKRDQADIESSQVLRQLRIRFFPQQTHIFQLFQPCFSVCNGTDQYDIGLRETFGKIFNLFKIKPVSDRAIIADRLFLTAALSIRLIEVRKLCSVANDLDIFVVLFRDLAKVAGTRCDHIAFAQQLHTGFLYEAFLCIVKPAVIIHVVCDQSKSILLFQIKHSIYPVGIIGDQQCVSDPILKDDLIQERIDVRTGILKIGRIHCPVQAVWQDYLPKAVLDL